MLKIIKNHLWNRRTGFNETWCVALGTLVRHRLYEGDPRSNANSCVISFTIAFFQDSLHQNYDALSNFPDPITILTESHNNPRCLATRE